jgi:hypothetical protein
MFNVVLQPQVVGLGCFHQSIDDSCGFGTGRSVGKEPAFAPNHEGPNRILHLVVADLDFTMVEKSTKKLLLVQGVGYGFLILQVLPSFSGILQESP